MTWATTSVRLRKTPSGTIDSRYPQGVLPGTPLAWSLIPNQSAIEGSPLSVDIRAYLSGTDSGTATITVDGTLPSGWSFAGSTLSYSGSGSGVANVRFVADGDAYSLHLSVEGIEPQPTDTLAPTAPPQIGATVSGASVTLEFDQSMDPHDGTLPGSQIQRYEIYRNDALLTSITSLGQGVSTASPMTQGDIGSPTAAGSSSQSGYDWSITSRGQVDGTADAFRFIRAQLSGAHLVTAKVTGITGFTSNFAKAGVMVRATADANSAFVCAQVRQNGGLRLEYRATAGGARVTRGTALLSGSARMDGETPPYVWLQLRQTAGDTWVAYYSEDGTTWSIIESMVVSLGATPLHGIFACASNADNAVTATFEDFAIAPLARGSYTHSPGASSTYKVRAVDNAANAGGFSHTVTAVPDSTPAPGPVQTRNWNPGHYIRPGPWRSVAEYKTWIDLAVSDGYWKGIQVIGEWKHLEKATYNPADTDAVRYASAFALLDEVLDYAAARGKSINLNIWPNNFNASPAKTSPGYINASPYPGDYYGKPTSQPTLRWWDAPTVERFTAMVLAIYDRYKDSAYFEFIKVPGETALGSEASKQSGYNAGGATANQLALMTAVMSLRGKPFVAWGGNFWPQSVIFEQILSLATTYGSGIGGPDVGDPYATPQIANANMYYVGVLGGVDYRGVLANVTNQEYLLTKMSAQDQYDIGKTFVTHMSWSPNGSVATSGDWASVRALLAAGAPLDYTDYPTAFDTE